MKRGAGSSRNHGISGQSIVTLIRLPNLLIIVLTQYFTAIFLIGARDPFEKYLFDIRLLLLSVSTVLIAAAGYIINDYYDIKIDLLNKPGRVVVGSILGRRTALILHWVLNAIGVLLGTVVNIFLGIVNLLAAFLLWFYSNHLKRIPLMGNFTVAFLTSLSLIVVLILYPEHHVLVLTYGVFAFFINLIREIIKDIEDLKGDREFGARTLPIVWGIRRTKYLLYILILIFVLLLAWLTIILNNYFLKVYFTILAIPAAFFVRKLIRADTRKDFGYLSGFSKVIMLSGIISMIFFKLLY